MMMSFQNRSPDEIQKVCFFRLMGIVPDARHERLQQFGLLHLAQKAQSAASDELIRMVQILPVRSVSAQTFSSF